VSQKTLDKNEVEKILLEFELSLIESDVAVEVAESLTQRVKEVVTGNKIDRSTDTGEYIMDNLKGAIKKVMNEVSGLNIFEMIQNSKNSKEVFKIVFLGINGTGKTTTIAKVAKTLKDKGFSVVLACGDTHRAGAIEQLKEHANRLSIKSVAQNYGADPASVARDAVLFAQSHRIDVVLIDTAGRMQTSKNLMEEMSKIIRVVNPDLKIFVGDSLAGSDAVSQAKEFSEYTQFDAAILTKIDADAKGGAALSIVHGSGKPIIFLGMGQEYDELIPFDIDRFISSIFGMG
jgi:fused signal recognition particle receptor